MANGNRKGSLIGGILLILIGVLVLMERWYGFFWLWHLISTWWPVVLIGLGLLQIFRYFGLADRMR